MTRVQPKGIVEIYLAAAQRLAADFNEARGYEHKGVSGDATANALIRWLKEQLPRRFSVVTGEVIDSANVRSGECDMLLIDALNCPTFLASGKTGLYPFYGVVARVEVSQNLSSTKRTQDFKKIVNFRRMQDSFEYSTDFVDSAPLGYMFAEGSPTSLRSQALWLAKQCSQFKTPQQRRLLPNGVVILSKGMLLYHDRNKLLTSDPVNAVGVVGIPGAGMCLFTWLLFMMSKLRVLLEHRIRSNTRRIWSLRLGKPGWPDAEWIEAMGGEPYFQDLPTIEFQQYLFCVAKHLVLIEI